jgi:hypothetical protein
MTCVSNQSSMGYKVQQAVELCALMHDESIKYSFCFKRIMHLVYSPKIQATRHCFLGIVRQVRYMCTEY